MGGFAEDQNWMSVGDMLGTSDLTVIISWHYLVFVCDISHGHSEVKLSNLWSLNPSYEFIDIFYKSLLVSDDTDHFIFLLLFLILYSVQCKYNIVCIHLLSDCMITVYQIYEFSVVDPGGGGNNAISLSVENF